MTIKPVWQTLNPYPEVAAGNVTEDSFVVSMGAIWERLELGTKVDVDPRYLDPEGFYRRTHFTDSMRNLLKAVTRRMKGEKAQSIHNLQVGMGGGKSHTLLLLYYLSKHPEKAEPYLKREHIADKAPQFRVAVIDGSRIDMFGKRYPDGTQVNTLWGVLFKALDTYEKYREIDTLGQAPSVTTLKEVLQSEPTLILIDEPTIYIQNIMGNQRHISVLQAFLQNLTAAVTETQGCALVVTAPTGIYEDARRLISAVLNRYSEPTIIATPREYKSVRRHALYTDDFDALTQTINETARGYQELYSRHLPKRAANSDQAIKDNYPFHPFVDQTLGKLKEDPAFQQIRDELRFLASLIYSVHKARDPYADLITVGHARLEDGYVRGGTIGKLKNPILVSQLDTELEERMTQIPEAIRPTAMKALATIVLNSLTATGPQQQGVTEEEAKYAILSPSSNPALIPEALKEIRTKLWFVDLSGDRYVFGRTNINKLIDEYMRRVENDPRQAGLWWNEIQRELNFWKTSALTHYRKQASGKRPLWDERSLHIWVHRSDEIPDTPTLQLILADYTVAANGTGKTRAASSPDEACDAVRDLYQSYGGTPRNYKNTVYFLVAGRPEDILSGPVRLAKELMALDAMVKDKDELRVKVGEEGIKQIDHLRAMARSGLAPSCPSAYQWLVYPSSSGLTAMQLGAERMLTENILSLVEDRLRTQAKKIVEQISPDTLLDRYWPKGSTKPEVRAIIEGFYRRPEIEVITDRAVAMKAIQDAVAEGKAAYSYGAELIFGKPPGPIRDEGLVIRDPEVSQVVIRAEDEAGTPVPLTIWVDKREAKATPSTIEDLVDRVHTINPAIPEGLVFEGWTDGSMEQERMITWDRDDEYIIKVARKARPPAEDVQLTIDAVNIKSGESMDVTVIIDNQPYKTRQPVLLAKDRQHTVRVETPKGMAFERWSDGHLNQTRTVTLDIDQQLQARFTPLTPGQRLIDGSKPVAEAAADLQALLGTQTREAKLAITTSYQDCSRHLGALMMLQQQPYTVELSAQAEKGKPLESLRVSVQAASDKQGELRSLITQLREYLDKVEVTLTKREQEFKPLREILSEEALKQVAKMPGNLTYRLIAMEDTALPEPTRSLQSALEEFKKVKQ
ncbi:MAG: DUF499 domain-containing protein [Candidatus Bathyarchaeota archaeon]